MNKRNELKKELLKRKASLILAGTMALTGTVGCASKKLTEETTTTEIPTTTTTIAQTIETTVETTKETVEVSKDIATEEYMNRAEAIAKAMYAANKEYFDNKDYTVEDLENVYYVINGKYYDNEKNLIMDKPELDRSYEVILELVEPQRLIELAQKQRDVEKGYLSYNEYMDELKASTLYDYSKAPLTNLFDVNEENTDIRDFVKDYSIEMYKTTENLKNCVSYEDHKIDFFSVVRSAQAGDITDYKGINNYLQETSTDNGHGLVVAAIYKSTADMLNTIIDGEFVTVKTKSDEEEVRVGLSYDEQELVNVYYLGDLHETEDILKARKYIAELFQTMPNDVICYKIDNINNYFNYQPVKENAKTI